MAAAVGRDVGYLLLRAVAGCPRASCASLRRAVEHGVLVADQAAGSFGFRHALLAEAVYGTILPGEREELHARLAQELTRGDASGGGAGAHWAAGRTREALAASVEAASQAEAVFGLAEALAHLERALALWPAVPDAAELVWPTWPRSASGRPSWRRRRCGTTRGRARPASHRAHRRERATARRAPLRAARSLPALERQGRPRPRCLRARRRAGPAAAASPERAQALASPVNGLALAWGHDESLAICEQALALARAVRAHRAELHALTTLGSDLAYLGRHHESLAALRLARQLAEQRKDPQGLERRTSPSPTC